MMNAGKCLAVVAIAASFSLCDAVALQVTMGTFNAASSGNYRANPSDDLEYVLDNYALGKSTDGTWFGTFCMERSEEFTPGHTYEVALSDAARRGGMGGHTAPGVDLLSVGSAYLYTLFATGGLGDSWYGSSGAAAALQNLFWFLEGEQGGWTSGSTTRNAYLSSLMTSRFGENWGISAKANYTGSDVMVMNLTEGRYHRQDQLVYVGSPVPDGGTTLALLGLGMAALAGFGRRGRN